MRVVAPAVSARMRNVRRANTAGEIALQLALRQRRIRFSIHESLLGCRPDVLIPLGRVVVFVDGDFWHGRVLLESGLRSLKRCFRNTASDFWVAKIVRNTERDRRQSSRLRRHGWSVLRFWESDVISDVTAAAAIVERQVTCRVRRKRSASVA
jgi:DNA mismatch endonuclease, patch repair protein